MLVFSVPRSDASVGGIDCVVAESTITRFVDSVFNVDLKACGSNLMGFLIHRYVAVLVCPGTCANYLPI